MFFSLFLLTLALFGFSEAEFHLADQDREDYAGSFGARGLSGGFDYDFQRANKEVSIEMVNEGMDKVVDLASALVEGTTPVSKRSGTFLAAAKPELMAKIQEKLKDAQLFAEKLEKAM